MAIEKKNISTPKTLTEALQNGVGARLGTVHEDFLKTIEVHVIDFLAQRFGCAMLEAGDNLEQTRILAELWRSIKS